MGSELYKQEPLENMVSIHDSERIPVKQSDRKPGPYPYYGASGITDYVHDYLFDGDYVLLAEDGDNLRSRNTPIAFMARGHFWVNNHAHILKGKNGNNTDFICYALQIADVSSYISGSTRPKITQKDMRRIPIFCPPIETQNSIVHILGTLDDKIELNRQMNATLEEMAQALFKSWFIDFDPVLDNAIMAGNPIPDALQECAKIRRAMLDQNQPSPPAPLPLGEGGRRTGEGALPKGLQKQFPSSFVFSEEMGWIPEGWEVAPVSKLAKLNPEGWTPQNHPEEVVYVDLANVKNGRINERANYTFAEAPSRARRVLRKDDTIVGTVRPGNRSFALIYEEGLTGSTGFAVLRPKGEMNRSYVYLALTSDEIIEKFAHLADGAAYPAIRPDIVASQLVVVPPEDLLKKFDAKAYPWVSTIGVREQMSESLAQARDTLLPKLLSGQLRIPDAEKLVAEAI